MAQDFDQRKTGARPRAGDARAGPGCGSGSDGSAGELTTDPRTLAAVLESAPEAVVLFDEAAEIIDWSPAAERLVGYPRDLAIGRNALDLLFPGDSGEQLRRLLGAATAGAAGSTLRRLGVTAVHRSGVEIPIQLTLGWAPGSRVFVANLVTRPARGAAHALADAEERHRSLIERLPAITYRAGLGYWGRWHYLSPQVEEILGYTPEECLEDDDWWENCVHPDDLARVLAEEERCLRERVTLDIEYRMRDRDDRVIWVRDRASIWHPIDGDLVVEGVFADITPQKEMQERLRYLADHDHLTDLLNRRGFELMVDERLRADSSQRASLAVIDLDHLKLINDSLGHADGDRVLCATARAISDQLRSEDVLGRLGGDEFGLFLPDTNRADARAICTRVLGLIRDRPGAMGLSASIGLTTADRPGDATASDLLISADMALYRAKERGRDRVAYTRPEDRERLRWVSAVREAIEAEHLLLHRQPIIDLASGERRSDELLTRMIGPDGRPVRGARFIPIAERFGLIRQIDRWVVERAVALVVAGHAVSVNISAASVADSELTALVERDLEAANVDRGLLTFEITETVATPAFETLIEFSDRIDRLGCRLALDDVGTGFGSFTYLQNLRFSELKIDRQFVTGVLESESDERIVRSLVAVAGELGIETVAEGIESAAVQERIRELGVDYAQGFHIGGPETLPPAMQAEIERSPATLLGSGRWQPTSGSSRN